jgi:chorismate mutase/prephenate dehydrogenase
MHPQDLEAARAELARIDAEVLGLVARRQALSAEIGRIKRDSGLRPRDGAQELEVMQRARRTAAGLGLPPALASALFRTLIETSLTVQERDAVLAARAGSGKSALVIGGSGRMGRWFVRFLASQGYGVAVADPAGPLPGHAHWSDWRRARLDQDVIVVAAPLRQSNLILSELAAAPPPGLVFDIGSLKTPLRAGLVALARAGALVTSIHPMFGPDTELLSERHVIFVDVGVPAALQRAQELFAATMAIQVRMDLDDHDRAIAYVLGLSHASNIAFFTALGTSGEAAAKLEDLSSPTFAAQLRLAGAVAAENPNLYFEIQALNEHGGAALAALGEAVDRLREIIGSADEAAFVALMQRGRQYLRELQER